MPPDCKDLWKNLDSPHREILLLTALVPPPVSLDTILSVASLKAVTVFKAIEKFVQESVLDIYHPEGTGHYYFPDQADIVRILEEAGEPAVRSAAAGLESHFLTNFDEGPKKWLTLTHVRIMSNQNPARPDTVLKAAQYCLGIAQWEAAGCYLDYALSGLTSPCRTSEDKKTFIDIILGKISGQGHLIPLSEQKTLLEQARSYARQTGDESGQVRLDLIFARVCNSEGLQKRATELFDESWATAQRLGNEKLMKWAALASTDFLFWQGRVAEAVERYEKTIGNLEEISASDGATLRACANLGWAYGMCGQTARGLGLIEAVRNAAEERGLGKVEIYADMMSVLTSLEARLLSEAERFLDRLLLRSEQELGHRFLWAAHAAQAFLRFTHGDLETSYDLQQKALEHSKRLGWPHHKGPWNFEYLDGLEDAGLMHPEMNYDSEVRRVLSWPDAYMRGVGFRCRAERTIKRNGSLQEAQKDLEMSLELLSKSGAKLELGRTQIAMGALLHRTGAKDRASRMLKDAWQVWSTVNEDVFPKDLRSHVAVEDRETLLVRTLVETGNTLGSIRDRQELLEGLITHTLRFSRAERAGFFQLQQDGRLELTAGRNLEKTTAESSAFEKQRGYIKQVAESGREFMSSPRIEGEECSQELSATWTVCCPVCLGDRVLGVLFMDSNLTEPCFSPRDLPLLNAIGNQIAVALDNVSAYEEISRLRDRLEMENRFYRETLEGSLHFDEIVGNSKAIQRVFKLIEQVAYTDTTVLIMGETGVGKELVARAIHKNSPRSNGPFIPINTASLAEGLVSSELFGHERGAFTGAERARPGRFEIAEGGTLFLDDVDAVPGSVQAQLLRVLQEKEYTPVGSNRTVKADFRLLAATSQDLQELVDRRMFRADFYYRLKVFPIRIPALRDRKDDIPLLAQHFLEKFRTKLGKKIEGIATADMANLTAYPWPGNVRELKHVIERAVILSEGRKLALSSPARELPEDEKGFPTFRDMEREHIMKALSLCRWKVSGKGGAARLLDLHPSTLTSKMDKLGIKRQVVHVAQDKDSLVRIS